MKLLNQDLVDTFKTKGSFSISTGQDFRSTTAVGQLATIMDKLPSSHPLSVDMQKVGGHAEDLEDLRAAEKVFRTGR